MGLTVFEGFLVIHHQKVSGIAQIALCGYDGLTTSNAGRV